MNARTILTVVRGMLCMMMLAAVIFSNAQTRSITVPARVTDSASLLKARFKPLDKKGIETARAKLVNAQWSFTLTPKQAAPTGFAFDKKRPVVVVLIHGITGYPTTDSRIGTLKGARNYWGYDFVMGLFGTQNDRPSTFADDSQATGVMGKPNWESRFINDGNPAHHMITVYGKPTANFHTPYSLMLTYRDGSQSIKRQVSQTASQIASLYQSSFGNWPVEKQPQIILLGHSFGGLVARFICSKPNNVPSVYSDIPAENFTQDDKENMEFIRNRTIHITTVATPHEGSPITWNAAVGSILQHFPVIGAQIDDTDPDSYVIKQLSTPFVRNLNNTVLSPEKCKRADGSLIPIHAIGGRVPAGPQFFKDPNIHDNDLGTVDGGIGATNIDALNNDESNRDKFECYNLVRVDYAMHLMFGGLTGKPWGATPANNPALDIISAHDVAPVTGCLSNVGYNFASFAVKPRIFYLRNDWNAVMTKNTNPLETAGGVVTGQGFSDRCTGRFTSVTSRTVRDGEIDNDGFVPINSALGVNLGRSTKDYFDHASSGSWYRFYRSGADFHNHGTIKFQEEVGAWIRDKIIGFTPTTWVVLQGFGRNAAGPKVASGGTVSEW